MFDRKSKILLILPEDMLDRARALAGVLTTKLKRSVSLQMVLRAFVDEGLKHGRDPAFLDNVDAQVRAVRRIRRRLHSAPTPERTSAGALQASTEPAERRASRRAGRGERG